MLLPALLQALGGERAVGWAGWAGGPPRWAEREKLAGIHRGGAILAGGGAPHLAWTLSASGAPWSPRFRALTLPQGPARATSGRWK